MELSERLRQASESIADHPRRVIASAMGVFWGSAAILVMLGWGSGFTSYMAVEMSRFGRPSVFVIPGVTSSGFPGYRAGVPVRMSRRDALVAQRENHESVEAVVAEHFSEQRLLVEARGRVRRLDLTATDERFPYYRKFEVGMGRFFDHVDVARRRPVAVLGHDAAHDLFEDPAAALGSSLRVDGEPFELIGVLAEKRGRQYNNTNRPDNRLLLVPASSAEARLGFDEKAVSVVSIYPRPGADVNEVRTSVLASLGRSAGFHPDDEDAVRYFDMTNFIQMFQLMDVAFAIFLGIAGTVTLLVGGVGIANYHLATLEERAVEIAVCKAIGARDRTLMIQAALESVLVAGGAALLGVGLGLGGCLALEHLTPQGMFPVPVISTTAVVITMAALVGLSVIAALVPALRVRTMDVSIALREGI
jgi:putative ABC transport system permease protein